MTYSQESRNQIIADGPFGETVARYLRLAGAATMGAVIVRASWRDVPAEDEALASTALALGVPWLSIVHATPFVRVGPAYLPGRGPCLACYRARLAQHSADPVVRDPLLDAALECSSELGVAGFPPHVAALAAGLALTAVAELTRSCGESRPSLMSIIDCRTAEVQSWRLTAVHGCAGCDRSEPVRRVAAGLDRIRQAIS